MLVRVHDGEDVTHEEKDARNSHTSIEESNGSYDYTLRCILTHFLRGSPARA